MGEPERAFVLLCHETSDGVHWDLMLDTGASLAAWQLAEDPTAVVQEAEADSGGIPVRRLPEHRRAYLEYEGPVGDNRGHVSRVDHGTYCLLEDGPLSFAVQLTGRLLSGTFKLQAESMGEAGWRFRRIS